MSTAWHGGAQHGDDYYRPRAVDSADDFEDWPPLLQDSGWDDFFPDIGDGNPPSPPASFHHPPPPPTAPPNAPSSLHYSNASLPPSAADPSPPLHAHLANSHRRPELPPSQNNLVTSRSQDPRPVPRDNVASALAGLPLYSVTGFDRVVAGPSQTQPGTSRFEGTQPQTRTRNVQQSEDWLENITQPDAAVGSHPHSPSWSSALGREGSEASDQGVDIDWLLSEDEAAMAPRTRQARTHNNAIDLTADPSSPPALDTRQQQPRSLRRTAAEAGNTSGPARPPKRQNRGDRSHAGLESVDLVNSADESSAYESKAVEHLDLTADDSAVAQTIAAQSALDSASSSGPVPLGGKTCIICMESFTDATITPCGHMYCFECLNQALLAGEKNSERGVGTCPVCRKSVPRRRNKTALIPVAFMKKSAFRAKGRGREIEAKAKAEEMG